MQKIPFALILSLTVLTIPATSFGQETPTTPGPPTDEPARAVPSEPRIDTVRIPFELATTITVVEQGDEPRRSVRYSFAPDSEQRVQVSTKALMEQTVLGMRPPATHIAEVKAILSAVIEPSVVDGQFVVRMQFHEVDIIPPERGSSQTPEALRRLGPFIQQMGGQALVTDRGILKSIAVVGAPASPSALFVQSDPVEVFRKGLREAFVALPEEPIGVGAHWRVETVSQIENFQSRHQFDYRLVRLDGDVLELAVEATSLANDQPLRLRRSRVEMKLSQLEGRASGTDTISLNGAFPMESKRDERVEMDIAVGDHMMHQILESQVRFAPAPPAAEKEPDEQASDSNAAESPAQDE